MPETDIVIAGAGPTGLVLALWLTRLGIRVRIVDKTAEPGTTSRALAVQARTLEYYRQIGVADEAAEAGLKLGAARFGVRGREYGRAVLGDLAKELSPFPFILIFPQDEHERLLIEHLRAAGVEVERQTEVVGFADNGAGVQVRIKGPDGRETTCDAAYLAGCDGARSLVRETLKTGFPGGTYSHLFYVADVKAKGLMANRELHVSFGDTDFLAVFPLKGEGRVRLVGTIRDEAADRRESLAWSDVSGDLPRQMGIDVETVNWFSTYRVHHRVAEHFRSGRVFLLGDAAHIHSPVGGQGMNTGIGDAVNLAWKLAAVVRGQADAALLDTYEPERIGFARRLVATTDRMFTLATSRGSAARFVRLAIFPRLMPILFRIQAARRFMFRTVSQIVVRYRESALSEGRAGRVHGGDRLPWVRLAQGVGRGNDNFAALRSLAWQAHVYGRARPELAQACERKGMPLNVFPWQPEFGRAGLKRDALYLIRPDGYVAYAAPNPTAAGLSSYLGRIKGAP